MLSKSTCNKLTLWLTAMVLLHAFLAWRSLHAIGIGMPDFSSFYAAAVILHDGHGYELYDDRVQDAVQRSFFPIGMQRRGDILPFYHPPFEALLFMPLARLPYTGAYLVWFGINLLLTIAVLVLSRGNFVSLGRAPFYLWVLAGLGFYPLFIALMQGQDSILVLLCYTVAFVAFRRGSEWREGACVGLGLCKFNLVVPFVFPLVLLRRKKFLAGFFSVAIFLAVLGLAAVGWTGSLSYPTYVVAAERNLGYAWISSVGHPANVRGIVESLLPQVSPHLGFGLIAAVSVVLLASVTHAARKAFLISAVHPELVFALSLIATALASYHCYVHDLSILFLAALIVLEVLLSSNKFNGWSKRVLYGCIGILFCSPMYMLLTMRYKHSELLGAVFLVFFAILFVEFLRIQPEVDASAPALTNPELH
jgi:Glycosyltransferase family 87